MKIVRRDLTFSGSLITGPTHNYLAVRFGTSPAQRIKFLDVAPTPSENQNLDVLKLVVERMVFAEHTALYPQEFHYRSDDTPSTPHYTRLLQEILHCVCRYEGTDFAKILTQAQWLQNSGASEANIQKLQSLHGGILPHDYLDFLRVTDGTEGNLSENPFYAIIYPSSEVLQLESHQTYKPFFDELLVFGGNGGGEAFAFDLRLHGDQKIIMFDTTNIDLEESIVTLADDFFAFSSLFKGN